MSTCVESTPTPPISDTNNHSQLDFMDQDAGARAALAVHRPCTTCAQLPCRRLRPPSSDCFLAFPYVPKAPFGFPPKPNPRGSELRETGTGTENLQLTRAGQVESVYLGEKFISNEIGCLTHQSRMDDHSDLAYKQVGRYGTDKGVG